VLYYLIGLILGASLGAATHGIGVFRVTSIKRAIGLSILYVEAMSLPMLTVAAVILKLTASETAQWFGISFVLHLVYGLVLGLVIGFGYRPGRAVSKDSSARG
jgi:NhaP-type Na+/H+ or K+/H+ antiporter